ncbi:hypothetical protein DBT_1342 [Dissulfuribacter thermophilus]|uniref:Uncharacterized protein n=1 Tax=Dissulfuribacter thermophilus TaxID=1156395 RepID=A0A1B9F5K5_9BACT|nr:hypothetical protein DBT_1342 [Dissulfuribacter thermophilus]
MERDRAKIKSDAANQKRYTAMAFEGDLLKFFAKFLTMKIEKIITKKDPKISTNIMGT